MDQKLSRMITYPRRARAYLICQSYQPALRDFDRTLEFDPNHGEALLGRAFVRKLGRYVLVSERSLDRTERFFAHHGEISTFLARMLPVVRHLISLPAGLARMPLPRFVLFTGLGATVWCTILTWIGWFIGRKEDLLLSALDDEARHYAGRAVVILLPILAVLAAAYFVWHRRRTGRGSG